MVAPNIVTAKSIAAKTETVNLTTVPAVLLQNSANSNQLYKISALFAANVTDSAATITAILTKAGDSGTIAKKIAHEIPIPANSTLTLLDRNVPIYLEERMTLIIYADVDLAIDVVCAYEEIGEKPALTTSSSSSSLSSASVSSSSLSSSSLSSASVSSASVSSGSSAEEDSSSSARYDSSFSACLVAPKSLAAFCYNRNEFPHLFGFAFNVALSWLPGDIELPGFGLIGSEFCTVAYEVQMRSPIGGIEGQSQEYVDREFVLMSELNRGAADIPNEFLGVNFQLGEDRHGPYTFRIRAIPVESYQFEPPEGLPLGEWVDFPGEFSQEICCNICNCGCSSSTNSSNSSSSTPPAQEFACVTPKTETFACVTPKTVTFACVEPLPGTYLCVEQIIQSSSSSSTANCADIPDRFSAGTPILFGALTGFSVADPVIFEKTEDGGWVADYVATNQATEYCTQDCQIEISISLRCENNQLNVGARVGGVDCEIIFDDEVGNNITTDENGNTLLPKFLFVTDTVDRIDINCADDEPIAPQCLCPTTQPCDIQPPVGPPQPPGPVDDLAIKLEVDAGNNNILIPPPAPQGAPQPLRLSLVDCPGCGDLLVTAELITGSAETETAYNNIVALSCSAGPVTRIGQGRYKANICPVAVGELQVTFTATWKNLTKSETVTVNVEYCPTPSDTSDTSSEPSDAAGCGYIECGGTQSYADCYLIDDGLTYELDCAACECVPVAAPSHTSGESTTSDNSAAAGQCDYPCEMMWSSGNWIPTGIYGPGCDGFTCICPEPDRPGNYENELVFMTCQPNPLP